VSNLLGQGRALPTELFSQYVFVDNQKTLFHLFTCQGRNVSNLLGQGRALPTELFSQYVFVVGITLPSMQFFNCGAKIVRF